MIRWVLLLGSLVLAIAAYEADLPDPGDLALVLGEEEFEDYLDFWLERAQSKAFEAASVDARSGCTLRVRSDLGQPQPVYLNRNSYLKAADNAGNILLSSGEQVRVACTGSGRTIQHPNIATSIATANVTCLNNNIISGAGWLNGNGEFGGLTCSAHSFHEAQYTAETCWNGNRIIRIGFIVDDTFFPLYRSCFDPNRLEVIYVQYDQAIEHTLHQTGVDRPSWLASTFFPGVGINNAYTQVSQKQAIANLVGQDLADKYVTTSQFLARGHLAAKSDFVFATGQRSSFYFINAAPQWQPFNAGNWNWLEQNLRARIGAAGYETVIYTGTFGVTQLRDQNNRLVDIFLHRDANNNPQLPVPLYFYKVAYDASRRIGTAFISINNPHYTLAEAQALQFCTDRCRNNNAFSWVGWQPDRVEVGYSFCCDVNEFRQTIPHLPAFVVNGLLS